MQMNTGKVIRTLRQTKHLSQKRLAEIAGISASYLCDMEKGRYTGSVRVLEKVAAALQVDIVTLMK